MPHETQDDEETVTTRRDKEADVTITTRRSDRTGLPYIVEERDGHRGTSILGERPIYLPETVASKGLYDEFLDDATRRGMPRPEDYFPGGRWVQSDEPAFDPDDDDGGYDRYTRPAPRWTVAEMAEYQRGWDAWSVDTAARHYNPRYHDGDEWRPANLRPDAVASLQRKMVAAGVLTGRQAAVRPGLWNSASADAYRRVLHVANARGITAEQALQALRGEGTEEALQALRGEDEA